MVARFPTVAALRITMFGAGGLIRGGKGGKALVSHIRGKGMKEANQVKGLSGLLWREGFQL